MPDGCVQTVITSPPYWSQRNYDAEGQIGIEPTPEEYVEHLTSVFAQVRRVLRDDGTCWLNLGDAYASGGPGQHQGARGFRDGPKHEQAGQTSRVKRPDFRKAEFSAKPKDLLGLPWAVAFALRTEGWYLRQDVIWSKPNPMPESVRDRPTSTHEHVFLLTKKERYFYDAFAIREPSRSGPSDTRKMVESRDRLGGLTRESMDTLARASSLTNIGRKRAVDLPGFRNARSVWEIATQPNRLPHFASFPTTLARRCLLAGTSEYGACADCGAPWARVVENPDFRQQPKRAASVREGAMMSHGPGFLTSAGQAWQDWRNANPSRTTGWRATCSHHQPAAGVAPCIVLDPFMGAGTTALAALRAGRDFIGIDLNPKYVAMAEGRIAHLKNQGRLPGG